MSGSLDATIRNLNDCGCCAGAEASTPVTVTNRPGLRTVAYRIGAHGSFKATLLAALSQAENGPLTSLKTRSPDDFTIALLDAWAAALDVLTFYQERIVNESFLRTATERLSVLHLARLIGYELGTGVASETALAFTLDESEGSPDVVTLKAGLKAQSVPGPDERPQTFETVETIDARPRWNAIRPRATRPQPLSADMATLWLEGVDSNLRPGDRLLVVGSPTQETQRAALRRVRDVEREDANKRTRVILEPLESGAVQVTPSVPGVWALRVQAAPFGHNAPKLPYPAVPGDLSRATEWPLDAADGASPTSLSLDAAYDRITAGEWLVIDRPRSGSVLMEMEWLVRRLSTAGGYRMDPNPVEKVTRDRVSMVEEHSVRMPKDLVSSTREQICAHIVAVETRSRASYGITGRVTQVGLNTQWLYEADTSLDVLRDTSVYAQAEALTPSEMPLSEELPRNDIQLIGDYAELVATRPVIFSGRLHGAPPDSPIVHELAEIKEVVPGEGFTTLILKKDLTTSFSRAATTISANVARATHGETVAEVLGSGVGSEGYQQFSLRQSPLTYVRGRRPGGADSTLQVRVNDILWKEKSTLFGGGPRDRIYTTRADDDGKVTVRFGDGATGARLPSGTDNVRAIYRKGTGKAGNVKAGQISLLMSRPLGLRGVVNPLPANGGDDPEPRERARQNAPLSVLTLDRIVSLRDYEDFARAFTGIAKALATWTWDGERHGVFLTIAGADGASVEESTGTHSCLVAAMRAAGDPYVPLRVKSYVPAGFKLKAFLTVDPDYLAEKIEADVRARLVQHFGFDQRGFGQSVAKSEVMSVIQAAPGVVGVHIESLHRTDLVGGGGTRHHLPARLPRTGAGEDATAAELLTLAANDISLTTDE